MKKRILYISQSVFPLNAPGIRVQRIADEFIKCGFQVTFFNTAKYNSSISITSQLSGISEYYEDKSKFHFTINDSEYHCRKTQNHNNAINGLLDMLFAYDTYKYATELCFKYKPYAIVLYNDYGPLTYRLLPFCKKYGIEIFADVTEWYENKTNIKSISDILIPRMVDYRIRHIDKGLNGVISISQYLHHHYTSIGVKSVCIPPLMPIDKSYQPRVTNSTPLLVYAGSPGEKDLLAPAINAVLAINAGSVRLNFLIIGINNEYIESEYGIKEFEKQGIHALGRITHEKVIEILRESDFSFLFRRKLRYAKAGFSTKLAESLSMGVPVICNSIGGSDTVIIDNYNGFVLNSCQIQDISNCLHYISNMSINERQKMKDNAFKSSTLFEGSNYDSLLKELIN